MSKWFEVCLNWFDNDDEYTEVEAADLDDAVRKVREEWGPTGWTSAYVYAAGDAANGIHIDLEEN